MTHSIHHIPLTDISQGSAAFVEPDRPSRSVLVTPPITANILLVDDDPGSLLAMETILAGPGRTMVKAESGQDALRHLLHQDFAVILLDVRMPRLDGFETAALIRGRARSRYTPIIFLSAVDTMDADVFRGLSSGAVDYLFKPVIPEVLQTKVSVFVELFRLSEQLRRQAVQHSEERFRLLVEQVQDYAIILLDSQGVVQTWNAGAQRVKGYAATEIVGQSMIRFYTQEDCAAGKPEALLQTARTAGRVEDEGWLVRKDGSRFWANVVLTALHDEAGQRCGFATVTRDLTERKQAEEEIRRLNMDLEERVFERTAQLQAILDNSPAIIFLKDTQGRYLKINPPFAKLTRLPREHILGKTDEEIFPPAQAAAFQANDAKVLQAGIPLEFEEVAQHEDGPHNSIVYKYPLQDAKGNIYAVGGIATDITERKRAEAQLQQRSAELEAVNKELNAFAYSVAHDLRAPLRAMEGFSQALLEDYGDRLDHVGQDYAQRIVSAAQHLDGLIQDLLAYSRLSQGELELVPVDLTRLLKDVQGQLKTVLQERQARVTVREPLPWVLGRNTTMGQILQNLLSNAGKFVASGVQPQVRVWAEERDKLVRLWVEDNGIGIAPEHQERIFRIFERLHGVETYPGTGIGLAIVRKAVERMGGRVGVESALGQGSRFWMELQNGGSP